MADLLQFWEFGVLLRVTHVVTLETRDFGDMQLDRRPVHFCDRDVSMTLSELVAFCMSQIRCSDVKHLGCCTFGVQALGLTPRSGRGILQFRSHTAGCVKLFLPGLWSQTYACERLSILCTAHLQFPPLEFDRDCSVRPVSEAHIDPILLQLFAEAIVPGRLSAIATNGCDPPFPVDFCDLLLFGLVSAGSELSAISASLFCKPFSAQCRALAVLPVATGQVMPWIWAIGLAFRSSLSAGHLASCLAADTSCLTSGASFSQSLLGSGVEVCHACHFEAHLLCSMLGQACR